MKDLPLPGIYSTPGMIAIGHSHDVPEDWPALCCLRVPWSAQAATMVPVRLPRFAHLNMQMTKGQSYRGGVLAKAFLHHPDSPDRVAVFCKCILDKEDLESGKYYDLKALFRSDPASKEAYDKMDPDGCVLDLEWEMVGGFSDLEVSIEVLRNGEIAEGDGDAVKIQAIKRRHPWRKDGWSRIELLSDLVKDRAWTMADILRLDDEFDASQARLVPEMHPAPPSGLAPTEASFESLPPDVMLINGVHFPIGLTPSRISHGLEYLDDDGAQRYGDGTSCVR